MFIYVNALWIHKKIVYQKITAYIRERKYAFKVTEIIGRESEKG